MRTAILTTTIVGIVACASSPTAGPLGEGSTVYPRISAVDSSLPPHFATVQLDQPEHLALLLIAPGHSATLLFPSDSVTPNRFNAGAHQIPFQIPDALVESDSSRMVSLRGPRDTTIRLGRPRSGSGRLIPPLPPTTPTYLLVVTSPQQLSYNRILEKTAGVSIPTLDNEALNAIGKAIKSTIPSEPRQWAGYFQLIELRRQR